MRADQECPTFNPLFPTRRLAALESRMLQRAGHIAGHVAGRFAERR